MNLQRFSKEHYNTVTSWWKKHEHAIIPESSLSSVGLIAFKGNKPICVSWLYIMSGCDLGQIAWTTTNPDASLREKYEGVNFCIDGLIELARHYKRKSVVSFSSSKGLSKIIKKKGLSLQRKHDLLLGSFMEDK